MATPEPVISSEARAIGVARDLGLVDYGTAYQLQLQLVEEKKRGTLSEDVLLLVEHPAVYTYGRKSKEPPPEHLANVYSVERGGEVTYHNPGQLVGYPILSLREGERDVHLHLRRLERTLIAVLAHFGIEGERRDGATGVWLVGREKKIASIGVALSSWVTFHGCALNVDNDLTGFALIHPCGYPSEVMTSMKAELGDRCPSLAYVKASFRRHFAAEFDRALLG